MDYFQLVLIGVLLLVAVTLGLALYMLFRWKVSFDGKEIIAFPSEHLNEFSSTMKRLQDTVARLAGESGALANVVSENDAKIYERVQALLKAVSETRAEYRTLREELNRKSAEVERYKEGYDLRLIKTLITPILANHIIVEQELLRQDLSPEHRRLAELLNESYIDMYESMGISQVSPEIGSSFRDASAIKLPPETIPADNEEQVGTVCAVRAPAYVMDYEGTDIVLREGLVTVYAKAD